MQNTQSIGFKTNFSTKNFKSNKIMFTTNGGYNNTNDNFGVTTNNINSTLSNFGVTTNNIRSTSSNFDNYPQNNLMTKYGGFKNNA